MLIINCKECGEEIIAKGKKVKCPKCGTINKAPYEE
jgi:Zn finger protein HypA/HybF involved in hydrogenase expression